MLKKKTAVLMAIKRHHETDRGWWFGHSAMVDELNANGITISIDESKSILKELRQSGKVFVQPIFSEDSGLLNGSGYFYKPQKNQ